MAIVLPRTFVYFIAVLLRHPSGTQRLQTLVSAVVRQKRDLKPISLSFRGCSLPHIVQKPQHHNTRGGSPKHLFWVRLQHMRTNLFSGNKRTGESESFRTAARETETANALARSQRTFSLVSCVASKVWNETTPQRLWYFEKRGCTGHSGYVVTLS